MGSTFFSVERVYNLNNILNIETSRKNNILNQYILDNNISN